MAGFGTVLARPLFDAFPGRILNTHPALLPAFPGWHAVEDALAAGVTVTGCTVHLATARDRRRPDPAPRRRSPVLRRRHRGDACTSGSRRSSAGSTRPPSQTRARRPRGGGLRGADAARRHGDEGAALRLRQDRPRRAAPRGCADLGWELVASGQHGRPRSPTPASPTSRWPSVTGAPEMLGGPGEDAAPRAPRRDPGRPVEARRTSPTSRRQGIEPIDLVVCNLYPFRSDPSIELIDVGGPDHGAGRGQEPRPRRRGRRPRRLRRRCSTSCAPRGSLSAETRRRLARAAFAHTAAYDAAIVAWFDAGGAGGEPELLPADAAPRPRARRGAPLRREPPPARRPLPATGGRPTWWDGVVQHAGTALSYLNLFDADAAWRLVHELGAGRRRGRGHHQARQPVRRGASPPTSPTPTGAPSSATRLGLRRRRRPRRAVHRRRWPGPSPRAPRPT